MTLKMREMILEPKGSVYYHELLASVLVNITDEWRDVKSIMLQSFKGPPTELAGHLVSQFLGRLAKEGILQSGYYDKNKKKTLVFRRHPDYLNYDRFVYDDKDVKITGGQ